MWDKFIIVSAKEKNRKGATKYILQMQYVDRIFNKVRRVILLIEDETRTN